MRLKELRGLPVVDPTAARKIGVVVDYQVDPVAGRIAALDVTPVAGGDGERVLAERIRRVGSSAVVLTKRGGATPSTPTDVNEHWLDTATLVGLDVMGVDGTRVGRLVDATFDADSLVIDGYLLQAGGLLDTLSGRHTRLEPERVHACSRELMVLSSGAAAEPREPVEPEPQVPLKDADKLAAPSFEPVADGHPVVSPPV
ncbi:MAG: PRC-barrel domain-containing protein [Chloroflexi bacterium]|nr:PRC-barrel domain-containing protein [Chloroflexota bacterium]